MSVSELIFGILFVTVGYIVGNVAEYRDDLKKRIKLNAELQRAIDEKRTFELERDRAVSEKKMEQQRSELYWDALVNNQRKLAWVENELANVLKGNKRKGDSGGVDVDGDVKKAIKYAMAQSHPDKGGKQEDFLLFHGLYKKYVK